MSKSQVDDQLRYGQGILLRGFKQEGNDIGFLTAKGFADATAKYETYKNLLYFKNYRNTIFEIIPSANFEINDELRKTLEINSEENSNVKILKARAKSQQNQFGLNTANKKNQPVCFGDLVIFKHSDSQTYLSGTIRPSSGKNGAFTVEVTKELSEILVFRVEPFRSFEKLGMPIPFDSPIKLKNMINNGYLTFQKIGIEAHQKKIDLEKKPIVADKSYIIPVKTSSTESEIYECVTHFVDLSFATQDPMPWQFVLHAKEMINDTLIQHDIIYFQHTQTNGILSTRGTEIILKELKHEVNQELPFYQCLWEIQKQFVDSKTRFILRHLMSGMTLGIVEQNGRPIRPQLIDISDGEESDKKYGVVELKFAKKEDGQIQSNSQIDICSGNWCLDKMKDQMNFESEAEEKKPEEYISISKLNQLSVNEQEYQIKKVQFTLQISKNCFIIKEIEDDLKKQVLFALSFHSKIIQLREDLKWGFEQSQKKVLYERMMKMTNKIKQIKEFLKNCPKELSDEDFIKPIYKRQMICKDLGISQLLFQLLFYMRKNLQKKFEKKLPVEKSGSRLDKKNQKQKTYIFEGKHNELEKFEELYNSIYEVIYQLVRNNKLFKIHISRWINFVFEDVLTSNQPSHLNLLKEILRDNQFLINNFVTDDLVKMLSRRMINQKENYLFVEKKYLEIFRLFCVVGDSINTNNQIKILNHFIKELRSDGITVMYQVTLTKKDDQIFTQAAIDKNQLKKRTFGDYYKICKEEYPSAWDYFVQYLNLIGDMTKGRNMTVQSYMETMFTLDILSDLFEKEKLHQAEAPIIRLLHNLYAESQRFYPIEKKKRISNYENLKVEVIDVMTTTSPIKPWEPPLKRVMDCMRKKLKEFGSINPKEMQKNSNLNQILCYIWQAFNLGFWEKKQDVKEILNEILRILIPHEVVTKSYAEAQIESKENILTMKCKLECMNIIQLILDYDLDLMVRNICKYFQGFKVPAKLNTLVQNEFTRLLEAKIEKQLAINFIAGIPADMSEIVDTVIISHMIQLSQYNNPLLTRQSISIIERVLLKKRKAIQDFCTQVFACGENRIQLINYIEEKKNKFYALQDQTLVNITIQNQSGNYVLIYAEEDGKTSGIMQDIYMMSQIIKFENHIKERKSLKNLDTSRTFKELGTSKLINFTDERTSSDLSKQTVLAAENIHLKVLEFVLNCKEIPSEELALKLLHLSYRFMCSLIWNFQEIKPTIINYIPQILHHIKKNVGCIDFLKEMLDNNKSLLYNEPYVIYLVKQICWVIQKEDQNTSFYKSKLLDFFRFLMYCNGKSLKFNQIQILKVMQDDSYKKIILAISVEDIREYVKQYQIANDQIPEKTIYDPTKAVKMQPKLLYLTTYFQILQSLIDDSNSVNMGKLQKRFPFETLVEYIKECQNCWPLKRNIRAFLNRLYYLQPEIETYMKSIIDNELDNVIKDLNFYIAIKSRFDLPFSQFKFQNPVRFSYLESYLYLNLQENLFTLYQLTTSQKIEEQMKNILHPLAEEGEGQKNVKGPYNFIRICQRLGFVKKYFSDQKNTFTSSFIKFLLLKFKVIISDFDDSIYLPGMNGISGGKRAPTKYEKQKARVIVIEKIMAGDISSFYVPGSTEFDNIEPLVYKLPDKQQPPKDDKKPNNNKLLKKLRQVFTRKKRPFKDEDEAISYKLNRLVKAIKLSPDANNYLTNQYNSRLSKSSQGETMFQYITTIIDMNTKDSSALPVNQKKFFLNLITGIVEQSNQTIRTEIKPIDQWESTDYQNSKHHIIDIQDKLKICKLGKFITQLLKENITDNIEFADSILLCGISYLFAGHGANQKNMIEEIGGDSENRVMRNIEGLISKLGRFILKNIDDANVREQNEENKFSITTIDNYDFYEFNTRYVTRKNVYEEETTDQQIYYLTCVRTYKRAFKFLQLLCENNNIDGKNFIREQPRGVKKFNFISIAAKQLRNLFQNLNMEICEVTMFLLDFLLEVTQIPVKLNQESLMSVTFFEDLCQLQGFFEKKQNVELRGFEGEQSMIEDIYFKGIQIILSNFEGNQKKTFQLLDSKLEPKFLVNILSKRLADMGIERKSDVIQYIDNQQNKIFQDSMNSVLSILMVLKKLKENLGDKSRVYYSYSNKREQSKQSDELYESLENCLLSIEIVDNSGKNQVVYFPKHPVFNSLSGNLRNTVMDSVLRSSHRDKIVSLLGYSNAIRNKIESSYSLLKNENISEANMNSAFRISAVMSLVVCIFMMKYYDVIIEYQQAEYASGRVIGLCRFALSLVQLSMGLVYAYYWYRFRIWEEPERKSREGTEVVAVEEEKSEGVVMKYLNLAMLKLDIGQTTQPLYKSPQFYRVVMYVGISFFGTFFHPALFFLHIMDLFCYIPDIGNIFKAIAINIKSLAFVSLMGIFFTFVFCTVTFSNYMKDVYAEGESEAQMCQTMLDCILQLFVSGAIGETMSEFQIVRFIYDMIYATFFGMLFGNIVSGLMLDSFGALREETSALKTDKQNYCFICNISREKIEKDGLSFKEHISGNHFLWNYIFFIYSLDNKSPTDYSGLQYQITMQYMRSDQEMLIDWVPSGNPKDFDKLEKLATLNSFLQDSFYQVTQKTTEIQEKVKEFNAIAEEYLK